MAIKYPFLDLKPVNKPFEEALKKAACDVISSGRYINGEYVSQLEKEIATLCGTKYAVAVSNGLDALKLIIRAYKELGEFHEGDEIIMAANTYIATALAVSDEGLKPVFVDISPSTLNLDTQLIEAAINTKSKAIMPVHLYGTPCWDETIKELASKYNLKIIEDNAQAIGAKSNTEGLHGTYNTGGLGHAAGISFYPTKNIGALGDAGAVITHDSELAATVSALANYGSDSRYHNIYAGFNCRLDPIQAAMLRVKISDTDNANARRFARAVAYNRHIQHPEIILPKIPALPMECVWHQYVIRVAAEKRDAFRVFLHENGVETDIHYPVPVHLQPCYASLPHGALPVSEKLALESISLPIGDHISEIDAREIAEIINKFK